MKNLHKLIIETCKFINQRMQTNSSNSTIINQQQPNSTYPIKAQYQLHFSSQHKSHLIKLINNYTTATNQSTIESDELALIDGVVLKKGTSIRFKVLSIGSCVCLGMCIRSVVTASAVPYTLQIQGEQPRHGCFTITNAGLSFCHSNKLLNWGETGFKYDQGDVIKIETNLEQLLFSNETSKIEFKMAIKMTENEWQQACFCVELVGHGDSVSIL